MGSKEKRLKRLLSKPKDFSYDELRALLHSIGYKEYTKGKTSGSRVMFAKQDSGRNLSLHIPHNPPYLKRYAIELIIDFLKESGDIE